MSYSGTYHGNSQQRVLDSRSVTLRIRQQPLQALVTQDGKEKSRKPIDPPPIVEIEVARHADPSQHYLVSPYYFMYATLIPVEPFERDGQTSKGGDMLGQLCSSLHRLKDTNNKDGGFFVFGDLSVRRLGWHRLRFGLYDVRGEGADHLRDILSEPFQVVTSKEFHGMEESSYLSRAFSDQGVRLRLRKEPRSITSSRRNYLYSPHEAQPSHNPAGSYEHASHYEHPYEHARGVKRQRSNSDFDTDPDMFPEAQVQRMSYPSYTGDVHYQDHGFVRQETQARMQLGYTQSNTSYWRSTIQAQPMNAGGWSSSVPHSPGGAVSQSTYGNLSEHAIPNNSAVESAVQQVASYFGNYTTQVASAQQAYGMEQHDMAPRAAIENFSSVPGLRTPTSLSDNVGVGVGVSQDQSYLANSADTLQTPGQVTNANVTQATAEPLRQYTSLGTPTVWENMAQAGATLDTQPPAYETSAQYPQQTPLDPSQFSNPIETASASGSANHMLIGQPVPQTFYNQEESAYPTPSQQKSFS